MSSIRAAIIFGVLLFLLSLRFVLIYHNRSNYNNGQYLVFETTLLSEPQISGKYQRFSVTLENGQRLLIIIPRYPELHYADTVRISGSLQKQVINGKKIIFSMFLPKIEAVRKDSPIGSGLAVVSLIRQKTISLFEKTLPPTSSSLLLGIVFGIKGDMPKEFMESLRISGVLHVIAASGMNVTMTAGFLSSLFAFFLTRQVAVIFSIIGILFYALLAGLEPSIIRATIMGILVFSAQVLGRQSLAIYGLAFAGYSMLFVKPVLLFDIGFQLSFLSTLGLIYIRPVFEKKEAVKRLLEKSIIGEGVITTISAQLATLPILFTNFGTYSLWSVVVNGLVLWVVPTLMVLGGAGAILGLVFTPLGQIFLCLALPFLLYFQKAVVLFGAFGGGLEINNLPWQSIFGYYSILIAVVLINNKKNP